MKYQFLTKAKKRRWFRPALVSGVIALVLIAGAAVVVRQLYANQLRPVSPNSEAVQVITIESGATLDQIANQLKTAGLIRSTWGFTWYATFHAVRNDLQAGTYSFSPGQDVAEIVVQLSHGKVKTDLVTIVPGLRLDQVRSSLLQYGFSEADIDAALQADLYTSSLPAGVPIGAGLEGLIYPDSYQKDASTNPPQIIEQALREMQKKLTPDLRNAFAAHGLTVYQAIILASIVEKEVSRPEDRAQVAQVFYKRLSSGMVLGSDVTAFYGAIRAGQEPSVSYDSPYNTRLHLGLPPTPISNVTIGSLQAVANPASTDWLYFVSGDDGATHFAKTLAEHEANVANYCKKLCHQ